MAKRSRIGIIGKGNVGSNLKKGLERAGYPVQVTGSDPKQVERVARENDVLIFAIPSDQMRNCLDECQGAHKGKVIVDVTNIVDDQGEFAGSLDQSKAEELQSMAPEASVVKAFNTVFAPNMEDGQANGDRLSAFVAGDDERSREIVERLAEDIGFDPVDAGPLKNARYLEALGYLNMQLGSEKHSTDQGFKLLHR